MKCRLIPIVLLLIVVSCTNSKKEKTVSTLSYPPEIEQLIRQSAADSNNIELKQQLINSLDSAKLYQESLHQIDLLIKKDSLNHQLWSQKGGLFEHLKDTSAAIKCYLNSIKIYPTPVALFSLAILYAETKNPIFEIVAENIDKVYTTKESLPNIYFVKGIYQARRGNTAKAEKYFDSCIHLNYHYLEAYMEKGFIYFDQQKNQSALTIFETVINIDPMYADGYYWTGKCYEQLGNKDAAIYYYQKANTLDTTITEAKKAIQQFN